MKRKLIFPIIISLLFLAGCSPGDITDDLYTSNILPNANATYIIGNNMSRYLEGHFVDLYADNIMGNVTISIGNFSNISVRCDGSIALVSMYDNVALNNSMYYSLNSSKAVYKDFVGVVNDLY